MDKKYFFHRDHMPHLVNPVPAPHIYDRTQKIFPNPYIATATPIGDHTTKANSFADIVQSRVTDILKKADGRPLAVSWSGGLDSTCVMAALMGRVDPATMTVMMNQESIDEYPRFYHDFIEGKIKTVPITRFSVETTVKHMIAEGNVVMSGEIGDQLFGSMVYLSYLDQKELMHPWHMLCDGASEQSVAIYQRIVDACPLPMTTVKMFYWWINYCLKYQGVQMRMILSADNARLEDTMFHFFDNKGFNDYAMTTDIETKYPGTDLRHYKMPMKQYINSVVPDADYFTNKKKVPSLQLRQGRLWKTFLPKAIDINWNREYA